MVGTDNLDEPVYVYISEKKKMDALIKTWSPESIDQQLSSPIFSRLPAEIRDAVFNFALTDTAVPHPEFTKYNLQVRHGKDAVSKPHPKPENEIPRSHSWLHPDIPGPSHIPGLSLLSTCRRIYLETRDLPMRNKQIHAFKHWHWPGGTYPPWVKPGEFPPWRHPSYSRPVPGGVEDLLLLHLLRGRQVRSLRVFASPGHMDKTFPQEIALLNECYGYGAMERMHTLHLTLRSRNWAAIDCPDFSFDPYNWVLKPFALADALILMPALRRLVIDFETEIGHSEAMEKYIDENVKEWQFLVLSNPPPTVFKVQGDNGEEIEWYWKPGTYKIPVGAKQTRAYQMVDPLACYVNDGHTSIPLSRLRPEEEPVEWASHPPPPSLADIKGDNGEPVKWGWLKLNLTKNPIEVRSYASPLPGNWAGPGFLRPLRVLDAEGQLVLVPQEEEEVEDMRLVSYRLEWTFRTGVPGEHVPAQLWCCDADGRYKEPEAFYGHWQFNDDDDL